MLNRKIALLLALILMLGSIAAFANNDEVRKREKQLEEIEAQIKALDASIQQNKTTQNELVGQLNTLNANMRTIDGEIAALEEEVRSTEGEIDTAIDELDVLEAELAEKKDLLNRRLRVMYKSGSVGYLEVLLGAEDFQDLVSRLDMIQKIYVHDDELIQFLKEQREAIEAQKAELEELRKSLFTLLDQQEVKKAELERQQANLIVKQRELKQNIAALEEQEDSLAEDARQVTRIIENLKLRATYVGGVMAWPAPDQYRITSYFGYRIHPIFKTEKMHTGLDIGMPTGSKIVAAQSGVIIYAGWLGGYGKTIMIDHGGGIVTLYGHNSSLVVSVGEEVNKGQQISKAGSTGNSTGPHLHFEVRRNGEYVDPLEYVTAN